MFVLRMAVRRMISRPFLTLSFLVGLLLAAGVAASIPTYTDGAVRRMLEERLQEPYVKPGSDSDQVARYYPPGTLWLRIEGRRPLAWPIYQQVDGNLDAAVNKEVATPLGRVMAMGQATGNLPVLWESAEEAPRVVDPGPFDNAFRLVFRSGFADHVTITPAPPGPVPDPWPENWEPEVQGWVAESSVTSHGWQPGSLVLYDLDPLRPGTRYLPIRIAGTFVPRDPRDPYWLDEREGPVAQGAPYFNDFSYQWTLMVPEEAFWTAHGDPDRATGVELQYDWFYQIDPTGISPWQAGAVADRLLDLAPRLRSVAGLVQIPISPAHVLRQFASELQDFAFPLLLFTLPLLIQLTYFLWLTAQMAVQRSAGEIAMLRSRGASPLQVVLGFAVEALILAAAAAAVGPLLGRFLARMMGAADGFLHFVVRQSLPLHWVPQAWTYAAVAASLGLVAVLPPAVAAARSNILSHRRRSSRPATARAVSGLVLGAVLLGFTVYAYLRLQELQRLGHGGDVLADPVLLLAPALGVYAVAVLAVSAVPLLSSLAARLAAPQRGVIPYLPLVHLARQPHLYSPLMLLVALTVGLGVNSSLTAETLDRLTVDRAQHQVGTELRFVPRWPQDGLTGRPIIPAEGFFARQPGVAGAARVVRGDVAVSLDEGDIGLTGEMLAVDPAPFSRVATLRRDLTRYHLHHYLLWLAHYPDGVLVTPRFLETWDLEVGDWVTLRPQFKPLLEPPDGSEEAKFRIVGTVEHWPSLYEQPNQPFFIVNRAHLEKARGVFPAEIWMQLEPEAEASAVIRRLAESGIGVASATYTPLAVYRERTTPGRIGLNGILSLSFVAGIGLTLLAFALHAGTGLQARLPRFGVLRAMGLSRGQLAASLVWEMGLSTLAAVGFGTAGGILMALAFLPLLDVPGPQAVPPIAVTGRPEDLFRLYLLTGLILAVVLGWVLWATSRLQLHIAVKLGQEE